MSLATWEKAWTRNKVKELECSGATKFWLCSGSDRNSTTSQWTIMCERTVEETGAIEEIIIFSADTEFQARKAFRTLRRVVGYVKCDNDIAVPGLF